MQPLWNPTSGPKRPGSTAESTHRAAGASAPGRSATDPGEPWKCRAVDNRADPVAGAELPAGGCPQRLDNGLRPLPTFPQLQQHFCSKKGSEEPTQEVG
jgi:hypothetical protein